MQKLNKSSRRIAHSVIMRVEFDNAYTDIVLSHELDKSGLENRDKAFVSELVRGVIRWKKRLDYTVNKLLTGKRNKLPDAIRYNLWLGLYQIIFMHVPSHAAVNEAVNLTRDLKFNGYAGLVNGVLRNYLRHPQQIQFADAQENPTQFLAMYYSYPEWMVKRWIQQFGFEKTEQICIANNRPPQLCFRINTCNVDRDSVQEILHKVKADVSSGVLPNYYRVQHIEHQIVSQLLEDGLITIQDESAAIPGLMIDPQPDELIVDVCAAPGGKSMHMAELSQRKANILSADLNISRCRLVQKANERLQHNVNVLSADALHFPVRQADKVLIDAPCSGLGVLAKKPDMRWHRSLEEINELNQLQQTILQKCALLVKPGGALVYSTCTIDKSENENIVKFFLDLHSDFYIDTIPNSIPQKLTTKHGYIRTWPQDHLDGSFCAGFKRKKND